MLCERKTYTNTGQSSVLRVTHQMFHNQGNKTLATIGEFLGYRGADKSLVRPGRKQATAIEDFDVHVSYLLS